MKKYIVALAILMLSSSAAWAARTFTPQSGVWAFSDERAGEPGRGLSIDVQGNTLFLVLYGYEKDGKSSFYTASGNLETASTTMPLSKWRGGRYFGSTDMAAESDGSPGSVNIKFTNGLEGVIELPGEKPIAIHRFLIPQRDPQKRVFDYSNGDDLFNTYQFIFKMNWFEMSDGQIPVGAWRVYAKWDPGAKQLNVAMNNLLNGYSDLIHFVCSRGDAGDDDFFYCTGAPWSADWENANPNYVIPSIKPKFRMANGQLVGWMDYQGVDKKKRPFTGYRAGFSLSSSIQTCSGYTISYVLPSGELCTSFYWMPATGTWVISDEENGKPGRGITLDVQDDAIISIIYDYRENGDSTFHMGSTFYRDPWSNVVPLNRYGYGRYMGGDARVAQIVEAAGNAKIEFFGAKPPDYGPPSVNPLENAIVTLPGESAKPMKRLQFGVGRDLSDVLLGSWMMIINQHIWEYVEIDRVVGDEFVSKDGAVACRMDKSPIIICRRVASPELSVEIYSSGFGNSDMAIKMKDRHGNSLGLGEMN